MTLAGSRGLRALAPLAVVAAVLLAACGSRTSSPPPIVAATPTIPDGWVTVSTTDPAIQMALPPWLLVFDNMTAIFANEAPPPGTTEIPIQLMAMPPSANTQPGPNGDLVGWLETRLGEAGKGVAVVSEVTLPAGRAVRYERIDRAGTPTAWHILAFAIRTPSGVAYLMIDGLPNAWPARAEDIERIPLFLRVR